MNGEFINQQRNVVYAYAWRLSGADIGDVTRIMEEVRAFCIEINCAKVNSLSVNADSVSFTAIVSNSGQHEFSLKRSLEHNTWSASSWLRVSSFKEISEIMEIIANHGVEARTTFAGIEMIYFRNEFGKIETEQRSTFDPDTF